MIAHIDTNLSNIVKIVHKGPIKLETIKIRGCLLEWDNELSAHFE